jgi:carbon-monoxide dehydrogenase large subunit
MSYGDAAAVEAAFAAAAHVVSLDLVSQRLVPSAMEPRSSIAEIDRKSGRLILHTQSQTPGSTRDLLAEAVLKRPKESVRVLVGDIGGGFGQKTSLYPEDGLVAYAAVKLARKVRWRGDRTDEFVGGTHGRDLTSTGEFALDAKGRVLAYRVRSLGGTGAYLTGTGAIIPLVLGPFVQSGVYDLPLVHYDVKAVMTNTAPVGAYRGAGRPEGVFIVERLMDAAARQIGMDPRTIRKVNYIKPAQLPYTNAVGQVYDSGAFAHMLERASKLADWDGFAARKKAAKKKGLLYGRGLTSYIEWTGGRAHTEKVSLHATAEGRVVLHSGTQAMGQGLQTTYSQMVAASLGIAIDKIDVVQGDTDLATGFGSVGSRSLFVGGTAVAVSTNDLIAKAREKASNVLEASGRGYRIPRRLAHRGRHRQAHRPVRDRQERKRRQAQRRQPGRSRRAELAQRHAYLRSRDRSGNRHHPRGALHHGRRRRRRRQSDAGDGAGPWRRRAGHRSGAV